MRYVAEIDEAACSAHGDCAVVAPEVFVVQESAVALAPGGDEVLEAARACPTVAIAVFEEQTLAAVYP